MYEVNLWFRLAEQGDDWEFEDLHRKATGIAEFVAEWNAQSVQSNLRVINASYHLSLTCYANRRRPHAVDLIDRLIERIIQELPGSYGLIYERDDETEEPPGPNAFRVTVLARGSLSVRTDPFLSPVVPTIEDD